MSSFDSWEKSSAGGSALPQSPMRSDSEDVLEAAASPTAVPEDGDLVRDPALDDLTEQACLQTNATGAAVALASGDDFVCVATTGDTAPDFGARLNTQSGLSAICLLTREMQHCDDTETDPRVNAQVCRQLGVRSVLVVPLLQGERLVGLFEIFSPVPQAFSDQDIQMLYSLSWQVIEQLTLPSEVELRQPIALDAINVSELENEPEPRDEFPAHSLLFGTLATPKETPEHKLDEAGGSSPAFEVAETSHTNYRTTLLTIAVIVVAVLLGWALGRGKHVSAPPPQPAQSAPPTESSPPPQQVAPISQAAPEPAKDDSIDIAPQSEPHAAEATADAAASAPQTVSNAKPVSRKPAAKKIASDGLVVYQNGKIIYRDDSAAHNTSAAEADSGANDQPSAPPVEIPAETADALIVHRVEPQYPEKAREQRVHGAVVLQAVVDDDGSVQQLRVVSGDPRLTMAAMDAVRHWEFRPYAPNGQPEQFETRITINFALPDQAAANTAN